MTTPPPFWWSAQVTNKSLLQGAEPDKQAGVRKRFSCVFFSGMFRSRRSRRTQRKKVWRKKRIGCDWTRFLKRAAAEKIKAFSVFSSSNYRIRADRDAVRQLAAAPPVFHQRLFFCTTAAVHDGSARIQNHSFSDSTAPLSIF